MKKTENLLILSFLFSAIAMKVMGHLSVGPTWLHMTVTLLTMGTLLGLCIHYLRITDRSIYTVAFGLMAFSPIGGLFKVQHWPGAGPMLVLGLLSSVMIAGLLIITAIKLFKDNKGEVIFNLVIATFIVVEIFTAVFWEYADLRETLNYGLLGSILIMKISGTVLKLAESRLITLVALQSTLIILSDVIGLISL